MKASSFGSQSGTAVKVMGLYAARGRPALEASPPDGPRDRKQRQPNSSRERRIEVAAARRSG